jgi:hypothetical protein
MEESLRHLHARLTILEARVRRAVAARRQVDPAVDDPFRGLYLSEGEVDHLLDGPATVPEAGLPTADDDAERRADEVEAAGGDVRLRRLARTFGLDDVDVALLVVAVAPDLDRRFERLYGYLHDDVTRRRPSTGLALELCGIPASSGPDRHRFVGGPLVTGGLLVVGEEERPFLTRSLQVPDRVVAHLLGDDHADPSVEGLLVDPVPDPGLDGAALARALDAGASTAYLRERPGASGTLLAVAALRRLGRPAVVVDLERLAGGDDLATVAGAVVREARLDGAGVVASPVEALVERGPAAVRSFAEAPGPMVLVGRTGWDPLWSRVVPVVVDVAAQPVAERHVLWRRALDGDVPLTSDPAAEVRHFRLGPEQIVRAATAARHQAALDAGGITGAHLRAGARAQNGAGLEHRARRIEPAIDWDDLVLPRPCLAALRHLADRARHRDQVIDAWGMRPGGGRGRGITALFAGDSGTGKTMSAEVIAGDLGLDLYAVNLATVVDKYVGETEKNLERIFSEADGVNAVLLFDEADALFGKRSEVRDAHDRYANIEVAYLLQRMETFDGLAILATNLRANLDEAFARRLDAVVDFTTPDEEHRRLLWHRCLGGSVPRADDVDLDFLARQFELSGGNIRSIAVTAAYEAAADGGLVTMRSLVRATHGEYRKLGRLCVRAEFGPWLDALDG